MTDDPRMPPDRHRTRAGTWGLIAFVAVGIFIAILAGLIVVEHLMMP